jgi:guanine deaminase
MPPVTGKSLFIGTFIHCKTLDKLEFWHNTAVFVNEAGVVVAVEKDCDQKKAGETVFPKLGWSGDISVHIAGKNQFFFPGFIGLLEFPPRI